jgi:hypothetical protein
MTISWRTLETLLAVKVIPIDQANSETRLEVGRRPRLDFSYIMSNARDCAMLSSCETKTPEPLQPLISLTNSSSVYR